LLAQIQSHIDNDLAAEFNAEFIINEEQYKSIETVPNLYSTFFKWPLIENHYILHPITNYDYLIKQYVWKSSLSNREKLFRVITEKFNKIYEEEYKMLFGYEKETIKNKLTAQKKSFDENIIGSWIGLGGNIGLTKIGRDHNKPVSAGEQENVFYNTTRNEDLSVYLPLDSRVKLIKLGLQGRQLVRMVIDHFPNDYVQRIYRLIDDQSKEYFNDYWENRPSKDIEAARNNKTTRVVVN